MNCNRHSQTHFRLVAASEAHLHAGLTRRGLERVVDLLDPDSVRSALNGIDKLFLLVGNVADELTQALLTVAVARQAKVKHITYRIH
jgi:uncharacterized protein YbjT (DUF2867 family)